MTDLDAIHAKYTAGYRALLDEARQPPPPPPEPARLRRMRDRAYLRRLHDQRHSTTTPKGA